jgi:flavin-dependent dehydrogenase
MDETTDVIVVGAGCGGLVASIMARARGFDQILIEKSELPDGSVQTAHLIAIVTVTDVGVLSERAYFDDNVAAAFRVALGDDFLDFPGVGPLVTEPGEILAGSRPPSRS